MDDDEPLDAQAGHQVPVDRRDDHVVPALLEDCIALHGVAGPVPGKEPSVGGPRSDIEPFRLQGERRDARPRICGGGFHDAVIDADPLEARVRLRQALGPRGAPGGRRQAEGAFGDIRLVARDEFQETRRAPGEHAGIPQVAPGTGIEEGASGLRVRLLAEALDAARPGSALDLRAQLEVPEAGGGAIRPHAEGQEEIRPSLRE